MAPDIKTHPTTGQLKILHLRLAYLFLRSAVTTIRIGRLFFSVIVTSLICGFSFNLSNRYAYRSYYLFIFQSVLLFSL